MVVEIPELENFNEQLNKINNFINCCTDNLNREWYTDEECWNLKGGGSLKTFRSCRYYQPKGGIPDAKVCGRKVWSKETVAEWLRVTDDQLDEYHNKYKTGAAR